MRYELRVSLNLNIWKVLNLNSSVRVTAKYSKVNRFRVRNSQLKLGSKVSVLLNTLNFQWSLASDCIINVYLSNTDTSLLRRTLHPVPSVSVLEIFNCTSFIATKTTEFYTLSCCHMSKADVNQEVKTTFYIPCALYLQYCWRWTGFSYGIDVIMTFSPKTKQLSLRRNTYTHPVSGAVCLHQQRNLLVQVSAAAFDVKGCTSYYKCSGLLDMTLDPDEEKVVLQLDRSVVFPLSISVHMALVSTNSWRIFVNKEFICPNLSSCTAEVWTS